MSIISTNIKYLRNKKGLSQTALADAIDLKRGNIASYEKELASPSIENLMKLSEYFKVDLNEFVKQDLTQSSENQEKKPDISIVTENALFQGLRNRVNSLKSSADHTLRLKALKKQNEDIFKIVEGFRAFHQHRMKSADHHNEMVLKIASDYDNTLDLLETVLHSNKELIKLLDK